MSITDRDLGFDESLPGEVASWTAQDFSNFFVRFRPQLERHASKFLRDKTLVDEVVQEAFLYLMVSLPELDSELGVLRFLKWKVRYLCLDVIKASKSQITGIDEVFEIQADDLEPSVDVERAEDAAIVRLALARLEPRQREALIANVYEEKTSAEIAEQLELSENATRQLLLRARNSLRRALVGEAQVEGLSLSEIISVAARKAAAEARKSGARAMGVLVIVGLGIVTFLNGQQVVPGSIEIADQSKVEPARSVPNFGSNLGSNEAAAGEPSSAEPQNVVPSPDVIEQPPEDPAPLEISVEESAPVAVTEEDSSEPGAALALTSPNIDRSPFDPWLVDSIFESPFELEFVSIPNAQSETASNIYTIAVSAGVWADITFESTSITPFENVRIGFIAGSDQFFADLVARDFRVRSTGPVDTYEYLGEVEGIVDISGIEHVESRMRGVEFKVVMNFDSFKNAVISLSFERVESS